MQPAIAICATPPAATAIARIVKEHGPVIFHVTGGCCDARSPMCLPTSELRIGARDVLIGEVEGMPVYEMESTGDPCCCCCGCFLMDLTPGLTVGFSIEAAPGMRFALREITAGNAVCQGAAIREAC